MQNLIPCSSSFSRIHPIFAYFDTCAWYVCCPQLICSAKCLICRQWLSSFRWYAIIFWPLLWLHRFLSFYRVKLENAWKSNQNFIYLGKNACTRTCRSLISVVIFRFAFPLPSRVMMYLWMLTNRMSRLLFSLLFFFHYSVAFSMFSFDNPVVQCRKRIFGEWEIRFDGC